MKLETEAMKTLRMALGYVLVKSSIAYEGQETGNGGTLGAQLHGFACGALLLPGHFYYWASLELSPSVESCGCGLGPSPVRLG